MRVTQAKPTRRASWYVRPGMKLVQVMMPKPLFFRFKHEAVRREHSFTGLLTAFLEQTAKDFDFEQLVLPERASRSNPDLTDS